LMDYDYPGNVRELLNILDRAAMLGEKGWVKLMDEHRAMNRGLLPAPVRRPRRLCICGRRARCR